jgi:hypothetical protein
MSQKSTNLKKPANQEKPMDLIEALSSLYTTDPFPSPLDFFLLVKSLPAWSAKLKAIAREKWLKWNLPIYIGVDDLVGYAEAHFLHQVTLRHCSREDKGFYFGPEDSRAYRNGKVKRCAVQGMHRGVRSKIGQGPIAPLPSMDTPDPRGGLPVWVFDLPEPHGIVIERYLMGTYLRDGKDEASGSNREDEILGRWAARAGITVARLIKDAWVAALRFLADHSPDAPPDQVSDGKALADSLEELGENWTMAKALKRAAARRDKDEKDFRASIEELLS